MILQEENQVNQAGNPSAKAQKTSYSLELDRAKIFWVFILSILVLTFVFVFGYWTGQYNVTEYQKLAGKMPVESSSNNTEDSKEELSEILGQEKTKSNVELESSPTEKKVENKELKQEVLEKEDAKIASRPAKKAQAQKRTVTPRNRVANRSSQRKVINKASKKYAIQLASFSSHKRAVTLRGQLLAKGYGGYVIKQGRIYRVRVGNFHNYGKAARTLSVVMKRFRIRDAYIFKLNA